MLPMVTSFTAEKTAKLGSNKEMTLPCEAYPSGLSSNIKSVPEVDQEKWLTDLVLLTDLTTHLS